LLQVLINLLGNAVRFSPRGASVDVEARASGSAIAIRVVDRGIGIAPEHHVAIFESFRQIDAGHTRKHGGAGLGLAIAKQLVELHGGRIDVDSALGKGAVFTVHLPNTNGAFE
jgi:signal transduction histidine kinase